MKEEHKAVGYKINRVVTNIDVRNRTSTTRTIVEEFKFNERGEKINIKSKGDDLNPGLTIYQEDTYDGYKRILSLKSTAES